MQDMAPFLILLGVVILGWMFFFVICDPFSSAFGYNDANLGPLWPVATVLLASMGNPISTVGSGDFDSWPALSMLCFFLFFVFIILCAAAAATLRDLLAGLLRAALCCVHCRLNVLIAIMADSYEMVKEHEKVEALHERAKMIADMELQHPGWHRYSQYMHICEAADEDSGLEPEWAGVAGRVKVLLAGATERTSQEVAAVQSDVAELLQLKDDVSQLKADMGTVKDLLAQLAAR